MSPIARLAAFVGLIVLAQGVFGLVAPSSFYGLIETIQRPPLIYVAAMVRIAIGVVLLLTASTSRAPVVMRCLGASILIGGVLTPFYGAQFAEVILGWWSQGVAVIRSFAIAALAIGAFILYATVRKHDAA